jgi:hypothetical protein
VIISEPWVNTPLGKLAHTWVTCQNFIDGLGTDAVISEVTYNSKRIKGAGPYINSVAPGVFFYFTQFTLDGSESAILIRETVKDPNDPNPVTWPLFEVHNGQVWLFEIVGNTCVSPAFDWSVDNTDLAQPVVDISNASAGTYVVQVKYTPNSVVGWLDPETIVYHYDFFTYLNDTSGDPIDSAAGGIDLVPQ